MIAASPVPAIAATVMRARRRIADHFFVQRAVTADSAVPYAPQRPMIRHQFERWLARGVIRQGAPGRYWLDIAAYQAESDRRRNIMVPVVVVLAVGLAVALTFLYRG